MCRIFVLIFHIYAYGAKIWLTPKSWLKLWIFKNLICDLWVSLGCWFSIWIQNLVQKCWSTPKLWPTFETKNGCRPPSWICWKRDFWPMDHLRVLIFHLCAKFGAKMSINAEIMAKSRNLRWRPSAMLDFRKTLYWPIGYLRVFIFHLSTKFGAKMLIDAEIMAKNRNPRWRPSAILEFLYHHIRPSTKSFRWATSACQILC